MKYLLALLCSAVFTLGLPMAFKHPDGAPYLVYTQEDALKFSTYADAYERIYNTIVNGAGAYTQKSSNDETTEMKAWRDNRGVWHFSDPSASKPEFFEEHIIEVEGEANRDLYVSPKPAKKQENLALPAVFFMFMVFFTFSVMFMTIAYLISRKVDTED